MAERTDWMPPTWGGKRAMGLAIKKHINEVQTELGLSAGDVSEIEALAQELMDVIDFYDETKSVASSLSDWRDAALVTGSPSDPLPDPATPGAFTTVASPTNGVLKSIRKWRDKWAAADGWTKAIAELLEVATPTGGLDPGAVKPSVTAAGAQAGGMVFVATVTDRGDAKNWKLKATPVGTTDTHEYDIKEGRFAEFTWPGTGGQPVQLQCQVQLYLKNEPYGIPSDIVLVTVIP